MKQYLAGRLDGFTEGSRKVVSCDGTEVGIFMVDGELVAWFNSCSHMRGPVCQGRLFKRVLEPVLENGTTTGRLEFGSENHIVCPWHGYEFDLKTGKHPGDERHRLRKANLKIADGEVYIVL